MLPKRYLLKCTPLRWSLFRTFQFRKVRPLPLAFDHPTTEELLLSSEKQPPLVHNAESILFEEEKARQLSLIPRVEKIEINYIGTPKPENLIMNKHFSTPYNCAQHMTTSILDRSPLALFDGQPWDIHRPLHSDGTLQFLSFEDDDPHYVNKAFWRTCCAILGHILKQSIKTELGVVLHSYPAPNIRTGSFLYDFKMNMKNWAPNENELRVLSNQMVKLVNQKLPIERLNVAQEFALKLFRDNPCKVEQIPGIASSSSDGAVTIYRIGNFVEISKGPMIAHTGFIGRCIVTAVHKLPVNGMYRIQGVALPNSSRLNHFAWEQIVQRARKLNSGRLPSC